MSKSTEISSSFASKAMYQIDLDRKIDDSVLELLPAQMQLRYSQIQGKEISSLVGLVEDQAQLRGILDALFNERITVISMLMMEYQTKP